jgi:hypothetical protein
MSCSVLQVMLMTHIDASFLQFAVILKLLQHSVGVI